MAKAIADQLSMSPLDLHTLGNLQLSISGCPNACGRHPVADIGFYGAARRIEGRLVPHYVLQVGGHVEGGKTELANGHQSIPARRVPDFLHDLFRAYAQLQGKPPVREFLVHSQNGLIKELLECYQHVPSFAEDENFYYGWEANELFSLAGRGAGECGAGVLDLIEVDLKSAAEALQEGRNSAAAALAARALLVTRGEQASNDQDSFRLFKKHFIDTGLIDSHYESLITQGMNDALEVSGALEVSREETVAFVQAVQTLFKNMDATLQFPKRTESNELTASSSSSGSPIPPPQIEKDFRGVVCPLNYVKTKMALANLKPGQILSVLLDDHGARNVPESVTKDGHSVLSRNPEGESWRVLIRKNG